MFLINGERRQCLELTDRALHYGDGLFETIEVLDGRPLFLTKHLDRLTQGCHKLHIPTPDLTLLSAEAIQLAANSTRAVLKLIVSRGSGGRGYRQPEQINPTRIFGLYPYPSYPEHYTTQGIAVRICQQRLAYSPSLAGIKHLNRLEQVLARAEWENDDYAEGLMLDHNDFVIEGTMSNVFIGKSGKILTPAVDNCGVAGILRGIVKDLTNQHGIPLLEKPLTVQALLNADEIFITNSVIGIWPVRQLEQQIFKVGSFTVTLQNLFNEIRKEGMYA